MAIPEYYLKSYADEDLISVILGNEVAFLAAWSTASCSWPDIQRKLIMRIGLMKG